MTKKDFAKIFKRFFITFLICIPIFVVIGFFLTSKIHGWTIVLYVVIGAGAFVLEELWWNSHSKKMEAKRQENLRIRKEKKLLKAQYDKIQEKRDKKDGK